EILLYFIFFLQAEDGIRDFHVTGVQTCALPIYFQQTVFHKARNKRCCADTERHNSCFHTYGCTNQSPGKWNHPDDKDNKWNRPENIDKKGDDPIGVPVR